MNYKQVQRYIRLTELVPELRDMDASKLAFTPAVEISFIRPKYQKYIAVAIEGQVSLRPLPSSEDVGLDKEGKPERRCDRRHFENRKRRLTR